MEVPNTENTDNVSLTCDYSRDVKEGDVVNVKWLSGNRVIVPGRVNNVNISIQVMKCFHQFRLKFSSEVN